MNAITPFLWFHSGAEKAVEFYTELVPDSKITDVQRMPDGSVLTIGFELGGRPFAAINGGPQFTLSEAFSMVINCETQEEVDHYWNALCSEGGKELMCGWCTDRFGLSWQVIPSVLMRYLSDKDGAKAQRTMQAMLKMRKIVISDLEVAYLG